MAEEMFEDKAIPWIASSKLSDQKLQYRDPYFGVLEFLLLKLFYLYPILTPIYIVIYDRLYMYKYCLFPTKLYLLGHTQTCAIAILGSLNPAPYWKFFFQMLLRLFQS